MNTAHEGTEILMDVNNVWKLEEISSEIHKCSKISKSLLFLFSNKMVVIRAEITKKLVRIAIREDPDQKQSDLHLCCLSRIF